MERLTKFAWMCALACVAVGLVGCLERKNEQEQQTPWQKKWNKRLDMWDKQSKKLHKELNRLESQLKALKARQKKTKKAKKPTRGSATPARRRASRRTVPQRKAVAPKAVVPRAVRRVVARRPAPRRAKALPIVTRQPLPRPGEARNVVRRVKPLIRRPAAPVRPAPTSRPAPARRAAPKAPARRAAPTSRPAPTAIRQPTTQKAPAPRRAAPASRPAKAAVRQPARRVAPKKAAQPAKARPAVARKAAPRRAAPRRPVARRKATPRPRPAKRPAIVRLTPIDLVKRRIKYVKNLIKWFTIGQVEMGKLRKLKPGMKRASTYDKKGKRTPGVWEYATQARYGLLSDYDWREGTKSITAYYLRKYIVLVVTFSKDQKMFDAKLTRCPRPGAGRFAALKRQAGIDWPVVEAIHRSPSIRGWSWHPTGLIRQANRLRAMGANKVLRGMSRYLRLARQLRLCRHKYDIDEQRILPLLRVLFARKKGAPAPLPWKIGVADVVLPKGNKDFPLFPLHMAGEYPLLLVNRYIRFGQPNEDLQRHIDDARKHGLLRSAPLAPKASVAKAVDGLVGSAAWKSLMSSKAQDRAESWKRPPRKINETAFRTYHKVLLRAQAVKANTPWPPKAQKKATNKRSKLARSAFAKLRSDDWKQLLTPAKK